MNPMRPARAATLPGMLAPRRCILILGILALACSTARSAEPFPVDTYEIDVGQEHIADVALYPGSTRAIVMFNDGPVRLRLIDTETRHAIDSVEGEFDQKILPTGGAVVGRRFFVTCYYGLFVIDLDSRERAPLYVPEALKGGSSTGVVVSSRMNRIYTITDRELLAVDPESLEVLARRPLEGDRQNTLAISRDDDVIYVADGNTGTLSRFTAADLAPLGSSSYAGAPFDRGRNASLAVAPDGSLYVGYLDQAGRFSVSTLGPAGVLLSTREYEYSNLSMAMTPDGRYLVTESGEIFARASFDLVAKVPFLLRGGGVQISRDGRRAYITPGSDESHVTVVDLTTIPRRVAIDIRPPIPAGHPGRQDEPFFEVAVLSTPDFDATRVLRKSVCFGNASDAERRVCGEAHEVRPRGDVDGDGDTDLLLRIRESSTGLELGNPEACLTGKTATGERVGGCGKVVYPLFQGPGVGPMGPATRMPPPPGAPAPPRPPRIERAIRAPMQRLFGEAGFDPAADIAGIILNRWGHAYLAPGPGFMFGADGREPVADVIRRPFGRIAIGHSELQGHQNWTGAAAEGRRAVEAVLKA